MSYPKIWPCPFCGEDEANDDGPLGVLSTDDNDGAELHYVDCTTCGGRGPLAPTVKQAINLWNGRHVATALDTYAADMLKRNSEEA